MVLREGLLRGEADFEKGGAITVPTAIGIIGHTIPPGRVKNYSFAFYSGGAPIGQVLGNILVNPLLTKLQIETD